MASMFANPVRHPPPVELAHLGVGLAVAGIVAVGDADGHSFGVGPSEYRSGKIEDVAVDNGIPTLAQETAETASEGKGVAAQATGDDLAAQRFYLRVVGSRLAAQGAEIHLKFLPVDMTQYMHQPSLDPPRVHCADNVKDSPCHYLSMSQSS